MSNGSSHVPTPYDYEHVTRHCREVPPGLSDLVEEYEELNQRDLIARHREVIGPDKSNEPLAVHDHLRMLALSEAIARRARNFRGLEIHDAVRAGATWSQVATALGTSVATVQNAYRRWVEGQHRLNQVSAEWDRRLGLDERACAEAMARLDPPEAQR
jgi:hypothetical protein